MNASTIDQWKEAWKDRGFRLATLLLLVLLAGTLLGFRAFLDFVELRSGVVLADPLLSFFTPKDLTWVTFALIYVGLCFAVALLLKHPHQLLRMVAAYIVLLFIRAVCMYSVPLDPPPQTIPLTDPLVELFGSTDSTLTKDLFFSGHTATLFLLGLGMPTRRGAALLFCATAAIALCVLWQHVHYTVDVLVAPLAAFTAFRITDLFRFGKGIQ
jgi:hypothetical protein